MASTRSRQPTRRRDVAPTALAQATIADSDARRADLAMRAYRLRMSGKSWWDIADDLGVTVAAASSMVSDRIRQAAELVDEGSRRAMLAMELDRLDSLQAAVWTDAMNGDAKAVDAALKVIDRRARLMGLDAQDASMTQTSTIVVRGTTDDYVAALRSVIPAEPKQIAS